MMMQPALVVAVIGGFCVLLVYQFSQAEVPAFQVPAQYEAELIEIDRQAVEAAYRYQVQALFQGWMKDSAGQPDRMLRGVNQARKAYVESMRAIDERSKKQ